MEINYNLVFREAFSKQQHKQLQEEAAKARLLRKVQLEEKMVEKKRLGWLSIRNLFSSLISGLKEIAIWFSRVREIGTGSRSSH